MVDSVGVNLELREVGMDRGDGERWQYAYPLKDEQPVRALVATIDGERVHVLMPDAWNGPKTRRALDRISAALQAT